VRKFVRRKLPNYIQIYLRADVDALMRRDPKGLYKKYNEGKMRNLIGVDDPYEEPQNADLIIDTAKVSIEEASRTINNYLKDKLSNES
jgi:adenylylsulfate kinase